MNNLSDYDELVKELRNCVDSLCGECKYQHLQKPGNFVPCMNAMITEAADAIEQLSEYADTIGRLKCEGWYLQQTKFHDGYQAIATMPLPGAAEG